jgi:hypothetical protein
MIYQSVLARAALALARRGLAVFPCCPRGKRPATTNGVKDATTDPDTIQRWWGREPQLNVAVATGDVSAIFVLDVDGVDAEAELRKLEQKYGELPSTVETITARGRHVFFKMPRTAVGNSASRVALGIDVRGDGGYVLVPPSMHPIGRQYTWSVDSASKFAAAPEWLIANISTPNNGVEKCATPPSEWLKIFKGINEGQRDNELTRLCGYFLRRYIDPIVTLELLHLVNAACCRPSLPRKDIERIVASIVRREIKRRTGYVQS